MFNKAGKNYSFIESVEILDSLPYGLYNLMQNPNGGFYLQEQDHFTIPGKIYGNPYKCVDRVLKSFYAGTKNLGAFFSGEKGSGKTLTTQMISLKSGLPTILVNQAYKGEQFKSFFANLKQDVCVLFDEFEKIYNYNNQNELLTLLDGNFNTKILFLFTSNESSMNYYLINRLSRMRYNFSYESLDAETVNDVIEDMLKNKAYKKDLLKVIQLIEKINLDTLIQLIKESNIHDESPLESVKHLNVSFDSNNYNVEIKYKGKLIPIYNTVVQVNTYNISSQCIDMTNEFYNSLEEDDKIRDLDDTTIDLSVMDKKYLPNGVLFTGKDFEVRYTRHKKETFSDVALRY